VSLDENGDMAGGDGSGDQLISIENVIGGSGDDLLSGNLSADRLEGGAGDDTIFGGGGADSLLGGAGDDVIVLDPSQIEAIGAGGIDGGSNALGEAADVDTLRIVGLTQGAFDLGQLLREDRSSRVENMEVLDLSNGTNADQLVQATISDLIALSDANATEDSPFAIKLDDGDHLSISDDPSNYSVEVQTDFATVTGITGTLYDYTLESDPTISIQVLLTNG
jgi:Ca2+-binding RTX toxin-like protein